MVIASTTSALVTDSSPALTKKKLKAVGAEAAVSLP
jgi:hypothetical protein